MGSDDCYCRWISTDCAHGYVCLLQCLSTEDATPDARNNATTLLSSTVYNVIIIMSDAWNERGVVSDTSQVVIFPVGLEIHFRFIFGFLRLI